MCGQQLDAKDVCQNKKCAAYGKAVRVSSEKIGAEKTANKKIFQKNVSLEQALIALGKLDASSEVVTAITEAYKLSHTESKDAAKKSIDVVFEWIANKQAAALRSGEEFLWRTQKSQDFNSRATKKLNEAIKTLGKGQFVERKAVFEFAEMYRTVGYLEGAAEAYDFSSELQKVDEETKSLKTVLEASRCLLSCVENLIICDEDGNARVDGKGNIVSYNTPNYNAIIDKDGNLRLETKR